MRFSVRIVPEVRQRFWDARRWLSGRRSRWAVPFSPESVVEYRALSFFRENLPANPRDATAFRAARWPRVTLDAAGTSEQVFTQAIRALAPTLVMARTRLRRATG